MGLLHYFRFFIPLFLWTLVLVPGVVVKGQEATVTATINISYDPTTRKIVFDQKGFVPVPNFIFDTEPSQSTLVFVRDTSFGVFGIQGFAGAEDGYQFLFTNSNLSCFTDSTNINLDDAIPKLYVAFENLMYVTQGYVSGDSLDGVASSRQQFNSLADAGFIEGSTCFFEYDVDNNQATGSPNGYEAAIVWNIIPQESSTPSSMPSMSQEPSSMPSQDCRTTSKSTKTPHSSGSNHGMMGKMTKAHMGMMMMTKASKTAAPTLCPETKAPKSS